MSKESLYLKKVKVIMGKYEALSTEDEAECLECAYALYRCCEYLMQHSISCKNREVPTSGNLQELFSTCLHLSVKLPTAITSNLKTYMELCEARYGKHTIPGEELHQMFGDINDWYNYLLDADNKD